MRVLTSSIFATLLSGAEALNPKVEQGTRRNAIGDFDEFNSLFENASVVFADKFVVNERVGIATLDMTIENLVCYDLSVGDIAISNKRQNSQEIDVNIGVYALDLTCQMDYAYVYGILRGDGFARITTDNNSAFSSLRFTSTDFDSKPPSDSSVDRCVADIEIDNLSFEGDFVSEILEIFQGLIRGLVEREIGQVACGELAAVGTSFASYIIDVADETLNPYLLPLEEQFSDPLYVERNLVLPGDFKALNLQDKDNAVSKLFGQALDGVDLFLGALISDDSQATDTGRDLAINVFIRDYFLDENRAFSIDANQLPLDSPIILETHDQMFETTMTLHGLKIFGLDTMSSFNPFIEIGKRTLQNELTWNRLTVEFDITVDIKPSSLEDAILQDPTSDGVSERVVVDFGVDNVDVLVSLLAVIDEDKLGSIELGSLLHTDEFIPCLFSVVNKTQLVGLEVDPTEINEPTLSNFISPGLDRIISDSAFAAFALYTGALRGALPSIFQTTVRDFLNEFMVDPLMADYADSICAAVPATRGLIDFQEFFGGSDKYGDVPPMLKEIMDDELLSTDGASDSLRINQALIAPFTKRQSGKEGTLRFDGDLLDIFAESVPQFGMDSVQIKGFDLRLDNLDSFIAPAELLQPDENKKHVLGNLINLADGPDSLQFGVKGLFAISGDPVLSMSNELEFSLDLSGSEVLAAFVAKMQSASFLTFPLRDVVNADCWLSSLVTPLLDSNGKLLTTSEVGLALEELLVVIPSLDMRVQCSNCTSSGLVILPELVETMESGGVSDVLEKRLVEVGLEILRSDFTQDHLNRLLIEGALRCPHSPAFAGVEAESNYPVPAFPSLTYNSLETIAFAATTMMHAGAAMIAESHQGYDLGDTKPLSGQAELLELSEYRFVDFLARDTSFGEWTGNTIDQLLEYMNTIVDDKQGPNGKDLRINNILRSNLLNENGILEIEFNDLSVGDDDTEISLKHVRVTGLDSIQEMEALDIIGSQTIQNKLKLKNIAVEVVLSIMGAATPSSSSKIREDITIVLDLADIDVSTALLMAIDIDSLGSLQLSSILEMKNIVPCLLSAARAAKFTELQVDVGSIEELSVRGFRSEELQTAATTSSGLILNMYGDKIKESIPAIFDMTVRILANNWMEYMMGEWSNVACPTSEYQWNGLSFVDFRDLLLPTMQSILLGGSGGAQYGNLFQGVIGLVQDVLFKVDDKTGLSALNEVLVGPWTRDQSSTTGTLEFPGELFGSETRLKVGGLDTNIELRASDAVIRNLDTVGSPLELFKAIEEAHSLNNTATFGVGDEPMHLAVRLLVALEGDDDIQVRNEFEVSADLSRATVLLKTMMMVAETQFYNFPLRDALDINCWLSTIPTPELDSQGARVMSMDATAALSQVVASLGMLNVNVSCIECSSPRMPEFADLISAPDSQEDVTIVANEILEYVGQLAGGNFVQVQIDRLLHDAAHKCPHSPLYDPNYVPATYEPFEVPDMNNSVSYLIALGVMTIIFVLAVALVVSVLRCIVRRRHKKWLGNLPPHQLRCLARVQGKEHQIEANLNASTRSMFTSPAIPKLVRWSMPLIIIGNIVFFLSGHLSLGATVNIEASIAGENLTVEKFFEFSMARSTIDIWRAGGRELAILIFIFSGVWPYTKQLITLALWFMPPSRVSIARRGSILLWLDWLAKWSMVDIFVLVISIAAFRVSVVSPELSFLPKDFYSIDMMVVPLWGLYANMIAQLISQVSSHFIIHYHRRIVKEAQKGMKFLQQRDGQETRLYTNGANDVSRVSVDQSLQSDSSVDDSIQREALRKHKFSRPHRGETERLVVRKGINVALFFGVFSMAIFIIIGSSVPSFSIENYGLVGVAVEFGQNFESATTEHSVFSVLSLHLQQARFLGSGIGFLGMLTMSVLVVTTVLIIPILQSLALMRQWFFPATRKKRARMAVFIEVLQAWQYVEVYLMAVFVSSWQLGPISEFMINSYCGNLKDFFAQAVYYGVLHEDDAQCFSVKASIEGGFYWLAIGAIILALTNTFVTKAVNQYFRDRDADEKRMSLEFVSSKSDYSGNTGDSDEEDQSADAGFSARIRPVPVLFTDTFRWLLRTHGNNLPASNRALFRLPDSSQHWNLPEAQAVVYDDDFDGSIIQGQYVEDKKGMKKKGSNNSTRSSSGKSLSSEKRFPGSAAFAAKRRLDFAGADSPSRQGSLMGSLSESRSVNSNDWQTAKPKNLKDDATYATPPGNTPRMRSQPRPSSGRSFISAMTGQSSKIVPPSNFRDELSVKERQTVESVQNDDEFIDIDTSDEYVEETIGEESYEEYTIEEDGYSTTTPRVV